MDPGVLLPLQGMSDAPPVWSETLRVRASEVGPDGLARPTALGDWLQEAAGNHATALGWAVDQLGDRGLTWVLSRLHVRVARLPRWRDEVCVSTWPAGAARAYALREFRVSAADGGELAVGTSGWLLVNLESRRPVRPPEGIHEMARHTPGRLLDDPFEKLPELAAAGHERAFDVRFADLDLNRHVNNVVVIGWALEALPHEVLAGRRLAELEIEFRAESLLGDRVVAQTQLAGDGSFLHRVVRPADGRELARARTSWI